MRLHWCILTGSEIKVPKTHEHTAEFLPFLHANIMQQWYVIQQCFQVAIKWWIFKLSCRYRKHCDWGSEGAHRAQSPAQTYHPPQPLLHASRYISTASSLQLQLITTLHLFTQPITFSLRLQPPRRFYSRCTFFMKCTAIYCSLVSLLTIRTACQFCLLVSVLTSNAIIEPTFLLSTQEVLKSEKLVTIKLSEPFHAPN